nr:unnamed protein product [Callosobruchus analis]
MLVMLTMSLDNLTISNTLTLRCSKHCSTGKEDGGRTGTYTKIQLSVLRIWCLLHTATLYRRHNDALCSTERLPYEDGLQHRNHGDGARGTLQRNGLRRRLSRIHLRTFDTKRERNIHLEPGWTSFTLYAFYFGYIVSHLPGGWVADKLGARHVMGSCMVLSTIITFVFPAIVHHHEYVGAMALRMLLGLVQGPLLPSIATFIQCWIPKDQRSVLGGIAFSGSNLGTMTGATFTGLMISTEHHWDIPFYVWGALAAAWCIFYMFMVFSHPDNHPFITEEELLYLKDKVEHHRTFTVPFRKILKTCLFGRCSLDSSAQHHLLHSVHRLAQISQGNTKDGGYGNRAVYNSTVSSALGI